MEKFSSAQGVDAVVGVGRDRAVAEQVVLDADWLGHDYVTESQRRIARYRPSSGPAAHAAGSRSASSTVSRNASTGSSVSKG